MSGAAPSGRKVSRSRAFVAATPSEPSQRSAREGGLKGQTSLANFLRPPAHVNALPSDVVAGHGGRQDPGTVAGPPAASPPRGGGNVGTREALGSVGLGPAGRIAVSASPTRDGLPLGHAEQPTDRRPPLALMTLSPLERDPTGTRSASTAAAMQELPVPNSPLGELSFGGLAKPGVFWKTSPTSLKLRREMSSRIRATAATQAASTEEGSRGGPSPPNADVEVDATGPTPSKRSGLKRFLSLDNLFAGKPESAGAKRPKRQHWANQSPEEAPSDGGAGASKLSDIISRAQKLLTSTPKRASVPTSPVRSAKKTTRSPFERSASTSWIPDIRSSSAAKGISPDKKQAAPEEFDFDFDIDLANMDLEAELAEDIEKLPTRKTFKFRRFLVLESHGAGEFRNSDIVSSHCSDCLWGDLSLSRNT
ncbi:hypothetical protein DFJ74DRAFT_252510 [Hyaloraphidium curvatum]|nr:hypothetical protein DFJ74DRAFT_252510 [Hyaloraphidium curvatum]